MSIERPSFIQSYLHRLVFLSAIVLRKFKNCSLFQEILLYQKVTHRLAKVSYNTVINDLKLSSGTAQIRIITQETKLKICFYKSTGPQELTIVLRTF